MTHSVTFALLLAQILLSLSLINASAEQQLSGFCNIEPPLLEGNLPTYTDEDMGTRTSESTSSKPQEKNQWTPVKGFRYPQVALDVDGYAMAPSGLQLEQVHVYVRHGERTPVGVRMSAPPASIPEHWLMCHTARRFRAAVSSFLGPSGAELVPNVKNNGRGQDGHDLDETLYTRKVVERRDGSIVPGECLLGELTDLGRQTTFHFGQNLRRLYVDKLNFMPDSLSDPSAVYFRSTNMPRTTESLQQIIHGLYPTHKTNPSALPPLLIRNGKDENLIGNTYACKRLEILQIGFAKAAAEAYNKTLEHLDKKVSKYIDGNPIRVDGKPRASGVMDTIRAAVAHGIKVPPEFEEKAVIDAIEQAVVNEWFSGYKTEEVRRLGMGGLLSTIVSKMQQHTSTDAKSPKLLVHSTHDTAIAALCSTLDVFDEKWPAFTASITFELFKQTGPVPVPVINAQSSSSSSNSASSSSSSSVDRPHAPTDGFGKTFSQSVLARLGGSPTNAQQHYIRMRYQNKSLVLPLCAAKGDHLEGYPEFCTFAVFKKRVKELTPTDWEKECMPAGRP